MGIYVNPGNIPFHDSRFSSIYVHKSRKGRSAAVLA